MRAVMMLAVTWCLAIPARADEALLARAEQRFAAAVAQAHDPAEARRQFAAAAADFAQLARAAPSPARYLALGNAEALAGHWPRALWAYQCGRRLDPNDAALRAQLAYARSLVNYPPNDRGRPAPDVWPTWLHRPGATAWLVLAAIAYSLAWLAGGWWYRRRRALPLAALLLAVATAAGAAYLLDVQQTTYDRAHPLVVVAVDATPLQRGNGRSYPLNPDMPNLPAGLEARVLHERGAWLQVELSTGEIGWVRRAAVLVVAPLAG